MFYNFRMFRNELAEGAGIEPAKAIQLTSVLKTGRATRPHPLPRFDEANITIIIIKLKQKSIIM